MVFDRCYCWPPVKGQVIADIKIKQVGIDTCINNIQGIEGSCADDQEIAVPPEIFLILY